MRVLNIYHIFPDVLGVDRCVFPREGGAKDVYQAVHQITPHIHMMWFDTIFIPSNHTTTYNNIFIYSISEEYSLNHATHQYDAV